MRRLPIPWRRGSAMLQPSALVSWLVTSWWPPFSPMTVRYAPLLIECIRAEKWATFVDLARCTLSSLFLLI